MRPVDLLATVTTWTWFGATLVVFDPVLRVARLLGEGPMDRTVSLMCRLLSWSVPLGLGRLQIEGLENVPRNARVIIIANHQSLIENFLPLWLFDHLRPRYVAKTALARWVPSVSFNLRGAGHCLIDRGDRVQALGAITRLGERVRAGEVSAIIFPEGTRSATGEMSAFKLAGLTALLEAAPEAPILPVVFSGGHNIFPRGLPRVRAFSRVKVRVLPPQDRWGENVVQTIERVACLLGTELEQLTGAPLPSARR
ncbi:MAG: 1-acyl-sn-glycerol-3-phosphate acyltransferase [Armatimonadetes bacterium]|nr:1-acyl-sn-glycerol-3-phosphate acyltransferase [Armatimonadota bacterium]